MTVGRRRALHPHRLPEAGLVTYRVVDSKDRPQGLHRAFPSLVPVFFCRTAAKSRLRTAVVRRHPRLFGWRRVLGAQLRAARATAGAALRRTGAGPRSAAATGGSER